MADTEHTCECCGLRGPDVAFQAEGGESGCFCLDSAACWARLRAGADEARGMTPADAWAEVPY